MRTGFLLSLPILVSALPFHKELAQPVRRKAITVPVKQWKRPGANLGLTRRQESNAPTVGLGDLGDLIYAVDVNVGGTDVAVHMDTGSSDLWVITDACTTGTCQNANGTILAASTGTPIGTQAVLNFGDSSTATQATGPINKADTTIAGLTIPNHPFAAVNFTNSTIVGPGVPTSGILGLSFPTASQVQTQAAIKELEPFTIDGFIQSTSTLGPLLTRMALSGQLEQPMFSITLQRDTVQVGGQQGGLTLGDLPEGVDNSTLTWVPVRLYAPENGGLPADPSSPGEIFPLRWEVVIDNVYFDGQQLPQPANIVGGEVSALIDTGNSLLRGPQDLVSNIYNTITPGSGTSPPSYPCSAAHTMEFEIGGQRFPIDPRDFVGTQTGDATTCDASRLVVTDPPSEKNGQLFSWSLGDPFMKSNLVAFYFGNLSHPSVDPPRIGFLSTVPKNADALLQQAVNDAQANGGVFQSTSNAAATNTIAVSDGSAQSAPTGTASTVHTSADSVVSTGTGSASSSSTDSVVPTDTGSPVPTSTDSTSSTGTFLVPSSTASSVSDSVPSSSASAPGGVPTTNSQSSAAAAPTNSGAAPTTSPPVGGGLSTSTRVAIVTSSSSSSTSAAPSASKTSGALSAARAPAAWAVALGALAMTLLSV